MFVGWEVLAKVVKLSVSPILIAGDLMKKGQDRLERTLARALDEAISDGEVAFTGVPMKPLAFVGLLMASIGGLKKRASSIKVLRRNISELVGIFFKSISVTTDIR